MAGKKQAKKVHPVVLAAREVEKHLSKRLMARIEATPWFFAGTVFEVLECGVVKVTYFHQKSDVDHWYRRRLMWREESSHKWRVDKIGLFPSLEAAVEGVDAAVPKIAA